MKKLFLTGFALAALSAGLVACSEEEATPPPQGLSGYEALSVSYHCDGDAQVQAIYFNFEGGDSIMALLHDGKLAPMRQIISGSGARYASLDEELGWRWYTKGPDAYLNFMAADHTATEESVLTNCREAQDAQQG